MDKDLSDLTGGQLELVKLVSQSAKELDEVIRDLGKIMTYAMISSYREKVFFQEEWSSLMRGLSSFIQPDMHIETDFRQAPMVFTVRPILPVSFIIWSVSNQIQIPRPCAKSEDQNNSNRGRSCTRSFGQWFGNRFESK